MLSDDYLKLMQNIELLNVNVIELLYMLRGLRTPVEEGTRPTAEWVSSELQCPPPIKKLQTLRQLEEKAMIEALIATNRNPTRAARLLGIGKTTMYRKIAERK